MLSKCIHLKHTVQWVLTKVCTQVSTPLIKIKNISFAPENSLAPLQSIPPSLATLISSWSPYIRFVFSRVSQKQIHTVSRSLASQLWVLELSRVFNHCLLKLPGIVSLPAYPSNWLLHISHPPAFHHCFYPPHSKHLRLSGWGEQRDKTGSMIAPLRYHYVPERDANG